MPEEFPIFLPDDFLYFREGTHRKLYDRLGSHPTKDGVFFAVWAPNAKSVSVIGDFNKWQRNVHPMSRRGEIWELNITGVPVGTIYKFAVETSTGEWKEKADPFANHTETPPKSGSIVWNLDYEWKDSHWLQNRYKGNSAKAPISIYEMHVGSWKRVHGKRLSYRDLAFHLVDYIKGLAFTHVELMPVMEHPYEPSWGYQVTSYFAPTSRFGTPQDLMFLIDLLHQNEIGVILDWVPAHFPSDGHGLAKFDGSHLYEHADPRRGFHPEWTTSIFDFGRKEIQSFLTSSAIFWLEKYHADALRIDGVASMLYLDYSRKPGEWEPNIHGGRENLEAAEFVKKLNTAVYAQFPDTQTIAEESTSWPLVTRPVHDGGLGFGMKWDMGWMHDTLEYFSKDPLFRKGVHNNLTFRFMYAFAENYVLSLSHDEIVHGKKSLLEKMPGTDEEKFKNLRLLLAWMYLLPGKKLLMMGSEFAQRKEWDANVELDWDLLNEPQHRWILEFTRLLNLTYRRHKALHELDFEPEGFEWVECEDRDNSIFAFLRKDSHAKSKMLCVFNFTPIERNHYVLGLHSSDRWNLVFSSDATDNFSNNLITDSVSHQGKPNSLKLNIPGLACACFSST